MNDIRIYYFGKDDAQELEYITTQGIVVNNLPNGKLVMQPGIYSLWSGGGGFC